MMVIPKATYFRKEPFRPQDGVQRGSVDGHGFSRTIR